MNYHSTSSSPWDRGPGAAAAGLSQGGGLQGQVHSAPLSPFSPGRIDAQHLLWTSITPEALGTSLLTFSLYPHVSGPSGSFHSSHLHSGLHMSRQAELISSFLRVSPGTYIYSSNDPTPHPVRISEEGLGKKQGKSQVLGITVPGVIPQEVILLLLSFPSPFGSVT